MNFLRRIALKQSLCVVLAFYSGFAIATPESFTTTIAFGSCIDDELPDHPIWNALIEARPGSMIFMGDNVYVEYENFDADTSIEDFAADYNRLKAIPEFQKLEKLSRFHAIWDDNDYGMRDGGSDFQLKEISRRQFLEFWGVEANSERYKTPGVHGADWIETKFGRVQIILMDTRFFRSPLTRSSARDSGCMVGDIVPNEDPSATMLGDEQWRWLEDRLQQPAELHVLVSSVQVIPDEHCFERWGAMPHERRRLLRLISEASAHTLVLSGDRHIGEISVLPKNDPHNVGYDLYEITSSPLSGRSGFGAGERNRYRIGEENVRFSNFGMIEIDWYEQLLVMDLRDQLGEAVQSFSFKLPSVPE